MKNIAIILVLFILFGCNNAKKRELNLKEKEIALKEREITLKEKELEQKNELAKTNNNQQDNKDATVTDIDGNVYKTVKIGNQIWMAENLKTTRYNDSTKIPSVTDGTIWANLQKGAYCYLNNDFNNNKIYGKLYNWYVIKTGKIAPNGWHVPSYNDWIELINFLGGLYVAGGNLKSNIGWNNNKYSTNISGFTALPSGICISNKREFLSDEKVTHFWSVSYVGDFADVVSLYSDSYEIFTDKVFMKNGLSIRCVKD
jgi:uncharacterized protein (TIGR02145 family)